MRKHFLIRSFLPLVIFSSSLGAMDDFREERQVPPMENRERWFPFKVYGPSFRPSGEILSGTAGTIAGPRRPDGDLARETPFQDWWNGTHMLGGDGHFGPDLRGRLRDRGVSFDVNSQGAFFGVVSSQRGARGFWNGQLNAAAQLNLGRLLENDDLAGVSFFGAIRYRDSWPESNANEFVEAQSMFQPSNWQSGTQFRLLNFGLEVDSGNHLPVEHLLTFKIGWLQPQKEFIDQPLSKLFLNNAINSAKGIGGNIPFSSSFSTWGGVLTVRPHENLYVRNALFMAFPQATASGNHGIAFEGFAQDPSQNGLFYMGEIGFTPLIGEAELPGKYGFGGYYYGLPGNQAASWNGTPTQGQYGFYFQADQMLYREQPPAASTVSSKLQNSQKAPVADMSKSAGSQPAGEKSDEGLKAFNLLTMSPGYAQANVFPFYFQSGLVYTGLVPGRDSDLVMIAFGYGAYQGGVTTPNRSFSAVLEGAYRYQINGWTYAQPFFQYIMNPAGTGDVRNAGILGVSVGVVF